MTDRPNRSAAAVKLVAVLIQAALGAVAAAAWLAERNTLQANGRWVSTKATLERGLLGAFAFLTERQTLAGGVLHLGAWHGFNEVTWRGDTGPLARLEFDFFLHQGAWLMVLLNRTPDGGAVAIRLSRIHGQDVSVLAPGGGLGDTRPLDWVEMREGRSHHARLDLTGAEVAVQVDGRSLGRARLPPAAPGQPLTFGFRGGYRNAWVNDVVAVTASGATIREGFDRPPHALAITLAVAAATTVLNLALFLLLRAGLARRRRGPAEPRALAFAFLAANLSLLVVAGLLYGFVLVRSSWYPRLDRTMAEAEDYFAKGDRDRVLADIRARHRPLPAPGVSRILLLGSSQTWGAGARRDAEVWVRVLEERLNAGHGGRFECVNGGFSSTGAADLAPLLETELLPLRPHLVAINLSSNDRGHGDTFLPSMRRMVAAIRAAGARPLLVKEANTTEAVEPGLLERHADLDRLGTELDVPVVDMHGLLAARGGDGLLWWDKVHLTSFGQRLLAETLARELERLGLLAPADAG